MDISATISELRGLASGSQRPAAARLRDLFDEVQAAIRAGVRRAVIRDALARNGLDMPFSTFVRTLARIRKERGIVASERTEAPAVAPTKAVAKSPVETDPRRPIQAAPSLSRALERRTHPASVSGMTLPDDWLTAKLTREQKELLTVEQMHARANAVADAAFPNPLKDAFKKENPA